MFTLLERHVVVHKEVGRGGFLLFQAGRAQFVFFHLTASNGEPHIVAFQFAHVA